MIVSSSGFSGVGAGFLDSSSCADIIESSSQRAGKGHTQHTVMHTEVVYLREGEPGSQRACSKQLCHLRI